MITQRKNAVTESTGLRTRREPGMAQAYKEVPAEILEAQSKTSTSTA
jgi:hypothetical protein